MDASGTLKLENQLCFPLYAASRMVTQQYKPLLDRLDITYPQYLVFLVLWEKDQIPVRQLSEKLLLETNTLTPLLKRLEARELITRLRSKEDERVVLISLTEKGRQLRVKAESVPLELLESLRALNLELDELIQMKQTLKRYLEGVNTKPN